MLESKRFLTSLGDIPISNKQIISYNLSYELIIESRFPFIPRILKTSLAKFSLDNLDNI